MRATLCEHAREEDDKDTLTCPINGCGLPISKDKLSKHLLKCHGYDMHTAETMALNNGGT